MKEFILEPSVDLIESMRSVGYSTEAAIADIIDNSIDANATHIQVDIDVVHAKFVAVLDNGSGMPESQALEALRFAGTAGVSESDRLGRFGLGLKTASLSQARCVTVLSKHDGTITILRWDLDHVKASKSWNIISLDIEELEQFPLSTEFLAQEMGTLVIWTKLDLLIGDSANPSQFLMQKSQSIRDHLALTFHRFMETKKDPLKLVFNGGLIYPMDPFLRSNPKTQISPMEVIRVGDATVKFIAYTLPHASGLSAQEHLREDLRENMRDFQGFYLYRNKRLLSKGHWFGLANMSEITKQTRIMVDIPQHLDDLWQVDIKKSRAEPPASFKAHLRRMIDPLLSKGKRVHTFRGRRESLGPVSHIWSKIKDRDGFYYEVNLDNPIVLSALSGIPANAAESVTALLEILGKTFPVLDSYQELAGNALPKAGQLDDVAYEIKLKEIYKSGLVGGPAEAAYKVLRTVEPFDTFEGLELVVNVIWGA